jgi:hypothetical protein
MPDSDEDRVLQKRHLQARVRELQHEMAELQTQLDDQTQLDQARAVYQRAADAGQRELAGHALKLIQEMEAVHREMGSKLEAAAVEADQATRALGAL